MAESLTYPPQGEFQYPNLTQPVQEEMPLGKYGRMHRKYLRENRKATYNRLLLPRKLEEHLVEIDRTATQMVEQLVSRMAEQLGVNEELKQADQMKWVGLMNTIRSGAEEAVLKSVVYR